MQSSSDECEEDVQVTAEEIRRKRLEYFNSHKVTSDGIVNVAPDSPGIKVIAPSNEQAELRHMNDNENHQISRDGVKNLQGTLQNSLKKKETKFSAIMPPKNTISSQPDKITGELDSRPVNLKENLIQSSKTESQSSDSRYQNFPNHKRNWVDLGSSSSQANNLGSEMKIFERSKPSYEPFSPRMQESIKAALGEKGLQDLLAKVSLDIERLHQEQEREKNIINVVSNQSEQSALMDDRLQIPSNLSKLSSSKGNIIIRDLQEITEGEKDLLKKVRNYEQVTVPKNTKNSFSVDEIYRQAYGGKVGLNSQDISLSDVTYLDQQTAPRFKPDMMDYLLRSDQVFNTPRRRLSYEGLASMVSYSHQQNPFAFPPPPPLYPGGYEQQGTPMSPHASGPPVPYYAFEDSGHSYYRYPQTVPQYPRFPSTSQYMGQTTLSTPPSPGSFYYPSPHFVNPLGVPTFPNGVPLHLPPPPIARQHSSSSPPQHPFVPHPPPHGTRRNSINSLITSDNKNIESALKVPHPPTMPPSLTPRESSYPGPVNRRITDGGHLEDMRFSDYKLERYFESLHLNERTPQTVPDLSLEPGENDNDDAMTSVTTATAKGVTSRLQSLGVDMAHLKHLRSDPKYEHMAPSEDFEMLSKGVRCCPECGTSNKAYMNWCVSCGEVLIGIEPLLPGNRKNKPSRTSKTNQSFDFSETSEVQTDVSLNLKSGTKIKRESYPHKDSPESGRGGSLTYSPVRQNFDDNEEPKDSGRASIGDLQVSTESLDQTEGRKNTQNFSHESNDDVSESLILEQISDPVLREIIIAYSKKELQKSSEQGRAPKASYAQPSSSKANKKTSVPISNFTKQVENIQSNVTVGELENISNENGHLPKKLGKRKKRHRDMAIDVEIFGYEEIRDSRNCNQSSDAPVVPALNLALSSEEEEENSSSESDSERNKNDDGENLANCNDSQKNFSDVPISREEIVHSRESQSGTFLKSQRRPLSSQQRSMNRGKREQTINNGAPIHQRHWARSNIAWSSFHPRELATRSSLNMATNSMHPTPPSKSRSASNINEAVDSRNNQESIMLPDRPYGVSRQQRPASAGFKPRGSAADPVQRPASAKVNATRMSIGFVQTRSGSPVKRELITTSAGPSEDPVRETSESVSENVPCMSDSVVADQTELQTCKDGDDSPRFLCAELHRLPQEDVHQADKLHAVAKNAYNKLQEMTPRLAEGEMSMWQCLPDEIWIYVFAFLTQGDLKNLMLTCRYFCRLANDETLWRYITVKPRCAMTDLSLSTIANHRPLSLAMVKCQGNDVSLSGLHNFFRQSQGRLRELNICGCSQGSFVGSILLNVASVYCQKLTHLDASYCNITDEALIAISECAEKFESVCVNGFQSMSDNALLTLLKKHGKSIKTLELYACFSLTASVFPKIGEHCSNLHRLCLGSCNKLTDSVMISFSVHLSKVEELDLRGCKHLRDDCIRKIVRNCPRIHTLVLANCQQISDVALSEVATYLKTNLRVLDVCGCNRVSDQGVISLAKNCDRLTSVDISSTRCSSTSVNQLASNSCNMYLENLRLSFLPGLSEGCVVNLIQQCRRLKLLHIFGCTSLRNVSRLLELNPKLCIEGDTTSGTRRSYS
ncbi:uncharacterized protein LOC106074555 [Biomphalaria glabrata]|uniref:Uncharacterized protein LOC106074555 n=1 Tax=Biomphalaria glabrata TaxID=6526 RepID=A0A9W3BLL8_BIOGL|nr:uncharacterized protein LOC106074555 [Biomphalaria glabrata]XP_055900455.1 uncharacterized protein LOC106074555 [Biomphalaria glabrata]